MNAKHGGVARRPPSIRPVPLDTRRDRPPPDERGRYGAGPARRRPTDQPARRATQQTHGFQFVPATYWPVVRLEVQPPGIAQSFQGNQRDFALLCSFRARGGPGLNA